MVYDVDSLNFPVWSSGRGAESFPAWSSVSLWERNAGQDTDCGHLNEGNPAAAPAVESGWLSPAHLYPALVLLRELSEPFSGHMIVSGLKSRR